MINVRDLRIGSYFNADSFKGHFTVFAINQASCDFIIDGMLCESYEKYLQPIPITPEWLEKLGFERLDKYSFHHNDSEPAEINVHGCGDNWRFTFKGEMGVDNMELTFWHVHQLQNYFYLATGHELSLGGGE